MNHYKLYIGNPDRENSFDIALESETAFPKFSVGEIINLPEYGKVAIKEIQYIYSGNADNYIIQTLVWTTLKDMR
jgi:hypothetical protein